MRGNASFAAHPPRLRAIANANYLRFDRTEALELLLKQPGIGHDIGVDVSFGVEYRPWLNNNVIVRVFGGVFQPLDGFAAIYQSATLYQGGTEVLLVY